MLSVLCISHIQYMNLMVSSFLIGQKAVESWRQLCVLLLKAKIFGDVTDSDIISGCRTGLKTVHQLFAHDLARAMRTELSACGNVPYASVPVRDRANITCADHTMRLVLKAPCDLSPGNPCMMLPRFRHFLT